MFILPTKLEVMDKSVSVSFDAIMYLAYKDVLFYKGEGKFHDVGVKT